MLETWNQVFYCILLQDKEFLPWNWFYKSSNSKHITRKTYVDNLTTKLHLLFSSSIWRNLFHLRWRSWIHHKCCSVLMWVWSLIYDALKIVSFNVGLLALNYPKIRNVHWNAKLFCSMEEDWNLITSYFLRIVINKNTNFQKRF